MHGVRSRASKDWPRSRQARPAAPGKQPPQFPYGRNRSPVPACLECEPFTVAAEQQVDGRAVADEFIFLGSPCETRAGVIAHCSEECQSVRTGWNAGSSVTWTVPAQLVRELLAWAGTRWGGR